MNAYNGYPPPRTTLAALLMLILGTAFLISGAVIFWTGSRGDNDRGFTLMILGGVMFLPGSYASFILFGAWLGWRGYDYGIKLS